MYFLLLMFTISVFATWHENLVAHVVDEENRPIPYANVSVKYQKANFPIPNDASLDGFIWKLTDQNGRAQFSFGNYVEDPVGELRYYIISAEYAGLHKTEKVPCSSFSDNCHPNQYIYTFKFRTKQLKLSVEDQDGYPISGADVYFGDYHWTTPASGSVVIPVPVLSSYKVVVEFKGRKRTLEDRMGNEDVSQTVRFRRYNVILHVIDDNGNPVSADVMVGSETKKTDSNGDVQFFDVVDDVLDVLVRYEGGFKELSLPISGDSKKLDLVIDNTEPLIENVQWNSDEGKGAIIVSATITDPGEFASGLDPVHPAKLQYNVEGEGWRSVDMYSVGKHVYQASIPLVKGKHIAFEVSAYDGQGNSKSYSDELFLESDSMGDESNDSSVDSSDSAAETKKGGNNLLLYGIIGLIVALIAYKKYTGEF